MFLRSPNSHLHPHQRDASSRAPLLRKDDAAAQNHGKPGFSYVFSDITVKTWKSAKRMSDKYASPLTSALDLRQTSWIRTRACREDSNLHLELTGEKRFTKKRNGLSLSTLKQSVNVE